jgi:HAD superfamily hydrolase (TIGR01484 family)
MIRLLSTDFDGTLVDHFGTPAVDPELFSTLKKLQSRGVFWAINTGRDLPFVDDGLEEFDFTVTPDFVVTAEREVFHRSENGKWQDFGEWNRRCYEEHDALFEAASGLLEDIRAFLKKGVDAEPIFEGSRMVGLAAKTEADMDQLCKFLEVERVKVPGFAYMRNTIWVRFCHEAYSKGTALAELARLIGVQRSEIFAAGDHYNDLPMLDGVHAQWVACPSNAVEAVQKTVRAAGGYVAEGRCSSGVVEALAHLSALGEFARPNV